MKHYRIRINGEFLPNEFIGPNDCINFLVEFGKNRTDVLPKIEIGHVSDFTEDRANLKKLQAKYNYLVDLQSVEAIEKEVDELTKKFSILQDVKEDVKRAKGEGDE